MDKEYLLSLKPRYNIILYIILIVLISLIICTFIFNTYDVYNTKGYLSCDDKCYISISVDIFEIDKIDSSNYILVKKDKLKIINTEVSEIYSDEASKSNYQIVKYEIDKVDIKNAFYDVKILSNYESIISKIINYFFKEATYDN